MKILRLILFGYYGAIAALMILDLVWPGTYWVFLAYRATWPTIILSSILAGNLPSWANLAWFLVIATVNGLVWLGAFWLILRAVKAVCGRSKRVG
jgi:hypothetical protein